MSRFRSTVSFANVTASSLFSSRWAALRALPGSPGTASSTTRSPARTSKKARPLAALKALPVGEEGRRGPAGPVGPAGGAGPVGSVGSARAYGETDESSGHLNPQRSGNASVQQPATGVYCIRPGAGIDPASAALVVTPDYSGNATSKTIAQIRSSGIDCDNPSSELEVMIWTDGVAANTQFSFLIP